VTVPASTALHQRLRSRHLAPASRFRLDVGWERHVALTAGLGALGLVVAYLTWTSPGARGPAATVIVLGAVAILLRPAFGVYLITFFAVLGDTLLAWWYPFTKNFSSVESVLYVHDAVIINPIELYLALTFVAWWLHVLDGRMLPLRRGTLFRPVMVFTGFVVLALVYGLVRGGNTEVALWAVRPLLYLTAVYVLAASLFHTRREFRALLAVVAAAAVLEALHATYVISTATGWAGTRLQLLGWLEHSASLHFNIVLMWAVAMFVFRDRTRWRRWLLLAGLVPVVNVYLHAERRSAVVALAFGLLLLAVASHRTNRRAFWQFAPALTLVAVVYLVIHWNGSGMYAFPAQAVKSVLAPDALREADQASNAYRHIETYNLVSTIRAYPLTGTGFGHPFLRPLALPWIPFVWAAYFPHNSILWIWINMGFAGFVSMLYLVGASIRDGARIVTRAVAPADRAVAFTVTAFVAMYVVFAYVDIAWDMQSMILLGGALATIETFDRTLPPGRDVRPHRWARKDADGAPLRQSVVPVP
jgi:hypothetical protein